MNRNLENLSGGLEEKIYIDKTASLERGIVSFPSVYVEGAAASGKTTAVQMLLEKHPNVDNITFFMEKEENADIFREKLQNLKVQMRERTVWVIFENIQGISAEKEGMIAAFVEEMVNYSMKSKVILVSRERPEIPFLKLLWKNKMELISMSELCFTKNEIQELIEKTENTLNFDKVYEFIGGGYPGCVSFLLNLAKDKEKQGIHCNTAALGGCPETKTYLEELMDTLSEEEQEIMGKAALCLWINQELCRDIWGISGQEELFGILERKGMLLPVGEAERWRVSPLFKQNLQTEQTSEFWKRLGDWYKSKHHIKEALDCLIQSRDKKAYKDCILEHFRQVPFLEHDWSAVTHWKENSLKLCYLRGMYSFLRQDMEGLQQEIRKAEQMEDYENQKEEILLNLHFVNPEMSLEEWLELLEKFSTENRRFRLYNILGGSFSYLCGLRDLSGMFASSKKEESAKAHIWQESLGEEEWQAYCQAKMIYYLETGRWDAVKEEEKALLERWCTAESWQIRLGCLYLLSKLADSAETQEYIRAVEDSLRKETSNLCRRNTEAVRVLAFEGSAERKILARRLNYVKMEQSPVITEKNYIMYCSYARGYMLLNQYEKAEKILQKVLPYLRRFNRSRTLAEILFLQGIVNWEKDMHGEALHAVIESFAISGVYRYMQFYTSYDKKGCQVLEAYVQWMKSNSPEGWHRKKKYNYGNILRMPYEDYIETLLRKARQKVRHDTELLKKNKEERLSMTETMILQDIGMGLTNQQIADNLGLKLPTIRNYVSGLYKKLGVSNRMQAVNKGKDLGILE